MTRMSVTLDEDATTAPPANGGADVSTKGRRWPKLVALVVLLLLVMGGIAFGIRYLVASHSRPITEGSGPRGARGPTVTDLGTFNTPSGEEVMAFEADFQQGRSFSYWVDLYNEGSSSVTITHIGPSVPRILVPERRQWIVSTQIVEPDASPDGLRYEPWRPITLGPQHNIYTLVTVSMTGCFPKNSWEVFGDTPVTYTVQGATVHAEVPMDFSVTMKGTRASDCPA